MRARGGLSCGFMVLQDMHAELESKCRGTGSAHQKARADAAALTEGFKGLQSELAAAETEHQAMSRKLCAPFLLPCLHRVQLPGLACAA